MKKHFKLLFFIFIVSYFLSMLVFVAPILALDEEPVDDNPATGNQAPSNTNQTPANPLGTNSKINLDIQVPFGELPAKMNITGSSIAEYVKIVYVFASALIVVIAIAVIIFGGVLWLVSAGNQDKVTKAKEYIIKAFIGLALATLGIVILGVVNPSTLYFQPLNIEQVQAVEFEDEVYDSPIDINFKGSAGAGESGAPPTAGEMPRLFQCDYRSTPYGCGKNVCSSGCGLTSSTMVLRYWGKNIDVPTAAKWIVDNGYRGTSKAGSTCSGTTYDGIGALFQANGMKCKQIDKTEEAAKASVMGKKPLIAHVRNESSGRTCKFTAHGHYIVIAGWDSANNRFFINDPGSKQEHRYNGTWNELSGGCKLYALLQCTN